MRVLVVLILPPLRILRRQYRGNPTVISLSGYYGRLVVSTADLHSSSHPCTRIYMCHRIRAGPYVLPSMLCRSGTMHGHACARLRHSTRVRYPRSRHTETMFPFSNLRADERAGFMSALYPDVEQGHSRQRVPSLLIRIRGIPTVYVLVASSAGSGEKRWSIPSRVASQIGSKAPTRGCERLSVG